MRHFQFSLRTLLAVTAWVAFMLGWVVGWSGQLDRPGNWLWFPGNWTLCAVGVLAFALARIPFERNRSSAAVRLVIAWQLACLDIAGHVDIQLNYLCVSHIGKLWAGQVVQEVAYGVVLSSVTLPLFLTLPLVYGIVWIGRGPLSPTARWLLYALAIPIADVILAVRLVSTTFGTWPP